MSAIYAQNVQTLEDLELQANETIEKLKVICSLIEAAVICLREIEQETKTVKANVQAMRLSQQACKQMTQSSKKRAA